VCSTGRWLYCALPPTSPTSPAPPYLNSVTAPMILVVVLPRRSQAKSGHAHRTRQFVSDGRDVEHAGSMLRTCSELEIRIHMLTSKQGDWDRYGYRPGVQLIVELFVIGTDYNVLCSTYEELGLHPPLLSNCPGWLAMVSYITSSTSRFTTAGKSANQVLVRRPISRPNRIYVPVSCSFVDVERPL
jgi:hypothetical protein